MYQTEFAVDPANDPHKQPEIAAVEPVGVQEAVLNTIAAYAPKSDNPQDVEDHMMSVLLSLLCYNTRALGIPFEVLIDNVVKSYAYHAPRGVTPMPDITSATPL